MSSEPPPDDQTGAAPPEPCMACRGTGQVVSHLGGTSATVTCPWCRGGGVRLADVDAQQAWREAAETGVTGREDPPGGPPAGGDAA